MTIILLVVPMIKFATRTVIAPFDTSCVSIMATAHQYHSQSAIATYQRQVLVRIGLILLMMIGLGVSSPVSANTTNTANTPRYQRVSSAQVAATQEIYLSVSQYELALIQVLSEICPSVLNNQQKSNFNRAYNQQLHMFMPRSANPYQALRQLTAQREYRVVLHNVRAWTASFPASENRALCREFASLAQ